MKVPENYVKSKCCHAYQDPSNTVCVRCGEPFQAEEAAEQNAHLTATPYCPHISENIDGTCPYCELPKPPQVA